MGNEEASAKTLPDISDAGIAHSAWMVYRMIETNPDFKRGRPRKYDGRPGIEWTGSVNKIINALWPSLSDRYLVEREAADEIKLTLNRYLRNTRNVVCMRNGGINTLSTWWVSDNWSGMTVKHRDEPVIIDHPAQNDSPVLESSTSDVFDVPAPEPTLPAGQVNTAPLGAPTEEEEMSEDASPGGETGSFACRVEGCTEVSSGGQGRASHERKHGIRFNADGSTTRFDPDQFGRNVTVGEVNRLIIDALTAHPEGVTHGDLVEHVLTVDPTIKRDEIKKGITRLMFKPWNGYQVNKVTASMETGDASYSRRLHLNRLKPTPADVPPRTAPQTVPTTSVPVTNESPAEATAARTRDDLSLVTRHADNLRAVLTDLERLSRLEEGLRQSSLKNRELVEKLRVVTAQRDELQGKLDGMRALLGLDSGA